MKSAEFDKFADEYGSAHARNIRASGETPEFFARYKVEDVAQALARQPSPPRRILDFGAGVGASVPHWRRRFAEAELVCLDVSERSLALGREQHGSAAQFRAFDGLDIPFLDGHFDVAFAACVFHHVDETLQVSLLRELRRVLAKDGRLFVFEHNPMNPLTTRAVNACEFDANALLIRAGTMRRRLREAGFARISLAYRVFFPGALRFMRPLERLLTGLPLGAQYRLCGQR